MAVVEVQRVSGGYTEHLNPFEVVIDDEVVGLLGAGEAGAFEVAAGVHKLFVRIYWCRSESVNIELAEGAHVAFRCAARANLLTDGFWATFGRNRYLRLEQAPARLPGEGEIRPLPLRDETPSAPRPRRAGVPLFLIGLAACLSLALNQGATFLSSTSVIFISVQAVIAVNFHFLAPRFGSIDGLKSHEPFRFRAFEEIIISCLFVLAGLASLIGLLNESALAGCLALGAAGSGFLNVVVTARGLNRKRPCV
jgi:hypothetical protein